MCINLTIGKNYQKKLSTMGLLITFCAKCKKYGQIDCQFVVINNKVQKLLIIVDNIHLWLYNQNIIIQKGKKEL